MEAIIRTSDKNLFDSLLLFLKSLHITVESRERKPIKKAIPKRSLKGSVLKYENPFGPATDLVDWETLK